MLVTLTEHIADESSVVPAIRWILVFVRIFSKFLLLWPATFMLVVGYNASHVSKNKSVVSL